MLDQNHLAGLGTDPGSQPVDAIHDAVQIMFGRAAEEPDLHMDNQHRVHRGP
jgi:hypothetical protein